MLFELKKMGAVLLLMAYCVLNKRLTEKRNLNIKIYEKLHSFLQIKINNRFLHSNKI